MAFYLFLAEEMPLIAFLISIMVSQRKQLRKLYSFLEEDADEGN
jgi:hypothetical protein